MGESPEGATVETASKGLRAHFDSADLSQLYEFTLSPGVGYKLSTES